MPEKTDIKDNSEIADQIKKASRTSFFQRAASFFGFTVKKGKGEKKTFSTEGEVQFIQKPTELQLKNKSAVEEMDILRRMKGTHLASYIQDMYEEWANDTQNTYANISERLERCNALTYMSDNEGIVKNAIELVASDVADISSDAAFSVTSEDEKWQNEHNILLKDIWKLDRVRIHDIGWDMCLQGEAFLGADINSAGVVGLNGVKVTEIAERLDFKASEVANFYSEMKAGGGSNESSGFSVNIMNPLQGSFASNNLGFYTGSKRATYKSTDALLRDYIENISDISTNEFFAPHLLGYRLFNDTLVAPWQIVHFRYNANVSEFWPYGQPPLLSCLAAYKQLQRVLGLDDINRRLSLPITLYKVKTNGLNATKALEQVEDVKEDFENVGLMSSSAGLEGPSLCTNIWTSEDLVSIEKIDRGSGGSDGNVDSMKFFYDRLASSLYIPRTYLDPSADGFQMSGAALTALFRPYRNFIYSLRAVIQQQIEELIRLHDAIAGIDTPNFVLTMNANSSVDSDDISKNMQMVDTVMEHVASLLAVPDAASLPASIKKDILVKYVGISSTELDNYLAKMEKEKPVEDAASPEEQAGGFGDDFAGGDDFGGDMGGDVGGDAGEDTGTATEESFRNQKNHLVEARYRAIEPKEMKMYLLEKVGEIRSVTRTEKYCSKTKPVSHEVAFLKKRFQKKKALKG